MGNTRYGTDPCVRCWGCRAIDPNHGQCLGFVPMGVVPLEGARTIAVDDELQRSGRRVREPEE